MEIERAAISPDSLTLCSNLLSPPLPSSQIFLQWKKPINPHSLSVCTLFNLPTLSLVRFRPFRWLTLRVFDEKRKFWADKRECKMRSSLLREIRRKVRIRFWVNDAPALIMIWYLSWECVKAEGFIARWWKKREREREKEQTPLFENILLIQTYFISKEPQCNEKGEGRVERGG